MGLCLSTGSRLRGQQPSRGPEACELRRLPPQLLSSGVLALLDQRTLLAVCPLVCRAWRDAAAQAVQSLNLSGGEWHHQLPRLLAWLQAHGHGLRDLRLSSGTPLGALQRRSLLLCCLAQPRQQLALRELTLQLDLDTGDLALLAEHLASSAPALQSLKLQPPRPSMADMQLLVLSCILGNLIGAESMGPVLPHLSHCSRAVRSLAAGITQLRSLSLSRYELGSSTSCLARATQLTSLALRHCGLRDSGLQGLAKLRGLRRLELGDNHLTAAAFGALSHLARLTLLDLEVIPSVTRMRSCAAVDPRALRALSSLSSLNVVGLGVAELGARGGALPRLTRLDAGLNPLSAAALADVGALPALRRLELGGVSQALVLSLSAALTPQEALRATDGCWLGLGGLSAVTALHLGGSNFSAAAWTRHVCPLLASGMPRLAQLTLAHCVMPPGGLQQLLLSPGLARRLHVLSVDHCVAGEGELQALGAFTALTRLHACSLAPKLRDRQAALLAAHALPRLRHLALAGNEIGSRGARALACGLTSLTALQLADNRVGRRCQRAIAHLEPPAAAEGDQLADDGGEPRFW